MTPQNSLQHTFDFFDNHFEKRKLYKLFPKFLDLRENFKRLNKEYHFPDKLDPTIFRQDITTGVGNEQYEVQWNINEVKAYIQKNNIPSQKFHIGNVYSDRNNLDFRKVEQYESSIEEIKDIFVVYYAPISTFLVIDGNHRIEVAKRRGQKIVKGYGLSPFAHHQLMSTELSKSLYTFHHNLIVLNNFSSSLKLWKLNIDRKLTADSFYSKTLHEDISFTTFKKLRLLFGL